MWFLYPSHYFSFVYICMLLYMNSIDDIITDYTEMKMAEEVQEAIKKMNEMKASSSIAKKDGDRSNNNEYTNKGNSTTKGNEFSTKHNLDDHDNDDDDDLKQGLQILTMQEGQGIGENEQYYRDDDDDDDRSSSSSPSKIKKMKLTKRNRQSRSP